MRGHEDTKIQFEWLNNNSLSSPASPAYQNRIDSARAKRPAIHVQHSALFINNPVAHRSLLA